MRVSSAAIFTLTALAWFDLNHPAIAKAGANTYASSRMQAPKQLNSGKLVVQLKKVVQIHAQQSQSTVVPSNQSSDVQYYQDYQVVAPTEDATISTSNQTLSTNLQPPILNQLVTNRAAISRNQISINNQSSTSVLVPPANDLVVTAAEVQIVGVSEDLEQSVRKVIQTRVGGETSESQIQSDVAAILATGLVAQARVTSLSKPSGLSVAYQLDPVVVRSLRVRYAHSLQSQAKALTLDVALKSFKPQLGNPISPTAISQSVAQINHWYAQNGYKLARVLLIQPGSDGVVTVLVAEGVVNNVKFRFFNEDGKPIQGRTQQDFLRRELKVKPSQVFQENLMQQDLQHLYQLGLFQNIKVALEGNASKVDVIYNLTEIPANAVKVGSGYNQDGIFGTVSYKDQNIGGVNQKLGVDVQASMRDLQFGASFTSAYRPSNPDRLGYQIKAFSSSGISETFDGINLPNDDRAREREFGGSITLQRPIDDWQTSLGLNYTRTSIRDRDGEISAVDKLGNPLSFSGNGIDDLTTVSFTATKDQRDNTLYPTQGSVLSFSTEQSIPLGQGNISMNQLRTSYSQYFPVQLLGKLEVLAFNIQGGTTIGDLPPYRAVNLGGINSVRGYETGNVASGRSYVLASAEYRFPVFNFIGGAVFADFASDLGSGNTILGEPGVGRSKPGTGFGYGVGVRLDSPIGLIRADFGINNEGDSRLQLGIGQRF